MPASSDRLAGQSEPMERVLGAVEQHMVWYDGARLRPVAGLPAIHRGTERALLDRGYVITAGRSALITSAGLAALARNAADA